MKIIYVTKDGRQFDNVTRATQHEKLQSLSEIYEKIKLCGMSYGTTIDFKDLIIWVNDNLYFTEQLVNCLNLTKDKEND